MARVWKFSTGTGNQRETSHLDGDSWGRGWLFIQLNSFLLKKKNNPDFQEGRRGVGRDPKRDHRFFLGIYK